MCGVATRLGDRATWIRGNWERWQAEPDPEGDGVERLGDPRAITTAERLRTARF
jgi:hypothetical protein